MVGCTCGERHRSRVGGVSPPARFAKSLSSSGSRRSTFRRSVNRRSGDGTGGTARRMDAGPLFTPSKSGVPLLPIRWRTSGVGVRRYGRARSEPWRLPSRRNSRPISCSLVRPISRNGFAPFSPGKGYSALGNRRASAGYLGRRFHRIERRAHKRDDHQKILGKDCILKQFSGLDNCIAQLGGKVRPRSQQAMIRCEHANRVC